LGIARCNLFAQAGVPCASEQKHELVKHKGEHPLPAPSADKALIFAIFQAEFGKSYQRKIAIDHSRWVAVLGKAEYTFFEADPGTITLSFYSGLPYGMGSLFGTDKTFDVKGNQTYVVRESAGLDLSPASEQEVAKLVRKLEYVTFSAKGKMTEEDWIKFDTKFQQGWQQLRLGLSPGETSDLLGQGLFGEVDKEEHVTDVLGKNSVTISGNAAQVFLCGEYVFDFQKGGPPEGPRLSRWKLQSWKAM
jgi:hypothetical protein